MPTPEMTAAYDRLVSAHNRLEDVRKRLNEAYNRTRDAKSGQVFKLQDQHYNQLQIDWDEAFAEFEVANRNFTDAIVSLHQQIRTYPPILDRSNEDPAI